MKITKAEVGDSIFLSCGKKNDIEKILNLARTKISRRIKIN